MKHRITVTLDEGTLIKLNEKLKNRNFRNKSHYVELALLDFMEKDQLALGRQFQEILPILWLRAGAIGVRPEFRNRRGIPGMLIPAFNTFAVLIDETHFTAFIGKLSKRDDITHVYLVTDSEEAFQEMAAQVDAPNVVQLYRDYLENFIINKGDGA